VPGDPLGEHEAVVEDTAPFAVLHDLLADGLQADALGPFVDALEIAALLAVELREGADRLDGLFLGGDMAQKLGALDLQTRGAGKVDVVAGLDADHADVLAGRLGAVARAARDRELDLGPPPRAPHAPPELDAQPRRILGAEAAPVGADAGFHRAQPLGIGVARDHAGG